MEFTDEQLEAVEQAILKHGHPDYDWSTADKVMAELRTKPKFAEGQVFAHSQDEHRWRYYPYGPINDMPCSRPLNPKELGPVVMEELRGKMVLAQEHSKTLTTIRSILAEGVKAFDAYHGKSDD